MKTLQTKPVIFISYSHLDEPEKAADGVQWLSFVTGYLRAAEQSDAVEVWSDRLMPGGAVWSPEIERKLRECDIFMLLISHNSLSSKYIVDKEIAIIRERQKNREDVHFYPLLLTPTPKIALDIVRDKNLRPRDAKPFSSYSLHDRLQHMADAVDEIVKIAEEIAARKSAPADEEDAKRRREETETQRRLAQEERLRQESGAKNRAEEERPKQDERLRGEARARRQAESEVGSLADAGDGIDGHGTPTAQRP